MYRHIPNQLTILRLVLAGLFFLILNMYRYPVGPAWALWVSLGLFLLAALTDWLDGYLARRWHVESTFGRIMDPFCDKVLIIGALLYLAGPRFVIPEQPPLRFNLPQNTITGVYPWMVALILARELLVTGIRGELEGLGAKFGANIWGKIKTALQLIGIPVILVIVYLDPRAPGNPGFAWTGYVRDVIVYALVVATVLSGVPYIVQARWALKAGARAADKPDKTEAPDAQTRIRRV